MREVWSEAEHVHYRPGHFCMAQLGDAGNGSSIVKDFDTRETYEERRYDKGECAILLRRYLNRVPDDASGLTFVDWEEGEQQTLIVNSSEVRAVGFELRPMALPSAQPGQRRELPARSTRAQRPQQGRGAQVVSSSEVRDPRRRYFLEPETDTVIRAVCDSA